MHSYVPRSCLAMRVHVPQVHLWTPAAVWLIAVPTLRFLLLCCCFLIIILLVNKKKNRKKKKKKKLVKKSKVNPKQLKKERKQQSRIQKNRHQQTRQKNEVSQKLVLWKKQQSQEPRVTEEKREHKSIPQMSTSSDSVNFKRLTKSTGEV